MKFYIPEKIKSFYGREYELKRLQDFEKFDGSKIITVYGRRRVGKTYLLEKYFAKRSLLKFEGIEGQDEDYQRQVALSQLAAYTGNDLLRKITLTNWIDFFELLYEVVKKGKITIYFEELQWLANYNTQFAAELKYYWDNFFRHNPDLIIILCGSSPSFMINKIVHSRALYNRSMHVLPVKQLSVKEAGLFLKKSTLKDTFDAYLSIGGIPEYLKYLNKKSSIFLSLADESFISGGFFIEEWNKIFTSSLASNSLYRKIILYLGKHKYASRTDLLKHLKIESGGNITELLQDLEQSGFIESYVPLHMEDDSRTVRYVISDNYLQFFAKFIRPKLNKIKRGEFEQEPAKAITYNAYRTWLGYAFERYCRSRSFVIAKRLGFSAIEYKSGAYFQRGKGDAKGYQIDLAFLRADKTLVVCEIKYTDKPVGKEASFDLDRKIDLIKLPKVNRIHKVLISAAGANQEIRGGLYFDDIIGLEDVAT